MAKKRPKFKVCSKLLVVILIAGLISLGILRLILKKNENYDYYLCKDCNVILITITNLRYDHMSMNGYFRNTTPNIDDFAKDAIIFKNTFTPASWTLPTGISIFTSRYPFSHKIVDRIFGTKLDPKIPTMVDQLRQEGYKTAAFTGGFDYSTKFGLTNRFDALSTSLENVPEENPNSTLFGYGVLASSAPSALEWLENNKNEKFFLFVQGFDAHCPFTPPAPYDKMYAQEYKGTLNLSYCYWTFDKTEPKVDKDGKYYEVVISTQSPSGGIRLYEEELSHMVALYDGEISYVDSVLGDFLSKISEMDLSENTIIIITSEHGDIFGKHGRVARGGSLRGTFYDDVVHVPLIIKHPKLKPKEVRALSQSIDIMPTLLDFLGLPKNEGLQGKSMIPMIVNDTDVHEFVFGGSFYGRPYKVKLFNQTSRIEFIRNKDWKLIRESLFLDDGVEEGYELYNLKDDPEELNNLYNSQNPQINKIENDLKQRLFAWLEQFDKTKTNEDS